MAARWLMRVASNPDHGAGHVSRSAALAAALAGYAPVTVVLDPGHVPKESFGHPEVTAIAAGKEGNGPWLGAVLDGYGLPAASAAARVRPLAVMDDFLDPPEEADLVINAAINLEGKTVRGIPALLGPAYACLDACFAELAGRPPAETVSRVAISLGMTDPENVTSKVLDVFAHLWTKGIRPGLVVVMGARAPHLAAIRRQAAAMPGVEVRVDVRDMAGLLRDSNLVVGAGGVSLFERLALGVPSVTLSIAENQRLFVEGAIAKGATANGGAFYKGAPRTDAESLATVIEMVLGDRKWRTAMRAAGRALVDGRGAERVAKRLHEMALARQR